MWLPYFLDVTTKYFRIFVLFFSCFLVSFLFSCAYISPNRVIKGLHFYPPGASYCGPASLATVMEYWGTSVPMDDLVQSTYFPAQNATLSLSLLFFAKEHDLEASLYKGNRNELIEKIDQGFPLIVSLKKHIKDTVGHFVIVYGYGDDCIFYWDAASKNGTCELDDSFLKKWSNAGNMVLWVYR